PGGTRGTEPAGAFPRRLLERAHHPGQVVGEHFFLFFYVPPLGLLPGGGLPDPLDFVRSEFEHPPAVLPAVPFDVRVIHVVTWGQAGGNIPNVAGLKGSESARVTSCLVAFLGLLPGL